MQILPKSKLGKRIFFISVLFFLILLTINTILFSIYKEPWGLPIIDNKDIVKVDQNKLFIQQGLHLILSIHEIRQKILKSKNKQDKIIEICKKMISKNNFVSVKKVEVDFFYDFYMRKKDPNQNYNDLLLLGNDFIFMLIKELDSIVNVGSKQKTIYSLLKHFKIDNKLLEENINIHNNPEKIDPSNFLRVFDFVDDRILTLLSLNEPIYSYIFLEIEKSQSASCSKKPSVTRVLYPKYLFVAKIHISTIDKSFFMLKLHDYIYRIYNIIVYNNKCGTISLFAIRKNKIFEIKQNSSIVVVQDLKKLNEYFDVNQKYLKKSIDLDKFLNIFADKENIQILNVYSKCDFVIRFVKEKKTNA